MGHVGQIGLRGRRESRFLSEKCMLVMLVKVCALANMVEGVPIVAQNCPYLLIPRRPKDGVFERISQ